jgi:hypothetical protein
MTDSTTRVPEKVKDLVTRPRLSPSARPASLTEPQRRALRGLLSGEVIPSFTPNLSNAMEVLIHADDTRKTVELVGSLIDDPSRTSADRASAAMVLRRSSDPSAPRILADNLAVEDPSVRIQVVKSLAAVGSPDQLGKLGEIEAPAGSALEKQVAFARDVIAHRSGMDIQEISPRGVSREPGKPSEMIDLSLRRLTKNALSRDRARLDGTAYMMPIGERGFRLSAGNANWSVFTNAEIQQAGGYSTMFDRSWLTAVLARFDERTNQSHVQYVVLSHPSGRTVRINVFRTDGELMYTGSLKKAKDLFEFVIRDVARKGTAPTNVSGRITKDGPVIDLKVPFGSRRETKSGREGVPI